MFFGTYFFLIPNILGGFFTKNGRLIGQFIGKDNSLRWILSIIVFLSLFFSHSILLTYMVFQLFIHWETIYQYFFYLKKFFIDMLQWSEWPSKQGMGSCTKLSEAKKKINFKILVAWNVMRLLPRGLLNITVVSAVARLDAMRRINIDGLNNKSKMLLWRFCCCCNFVFKGEKGFLFVYDCQKHCCVFFIIKRK